jgi:hypothetical protein
MAKMMSNPAVGHLRGTVGDLVFVQQRTGDVVVRMRSRRRAPKREQEAANQQRFREAVAYAKSVWATQPELKGRYQAEAKLTGRQGFNLAKADYRLLPSVDDVGLTGYRGNIGETIGIKATDNFEVRTVGVMIRELDGTMLEQGPAVPSGGQWVYRSQTQVPAGQTVVVEVTATDHPGHSATKKVDHACGPRD